MMTAKLGVTPMTQILFLLGTMLAAPPLSGTDARRRVPDHVPPKRSSQIADGFGINSDLPRDPYLPWNRWWWTRMFDAGVNWIRIGQYENSSDRTSWDWIEQKRGVLTLVSGTRRLRGLAGRERRQCPGPTPLR